THVPADKDEGIARILTHGRDRAWLGHGGCGRRLREKRRRTGGRAPGRSVTGGRQGMAGRHRQNGQRPDTRQHRAARSHDICPFYTTLVNINVPVNPFVENPPRASRSGVTRLCRTPAQCLPIILRTAARKSNNSAKVSADCLTFGLPWKVKTNKSPNR